MENLTINQGIKFTAGDGTGVIGTADPSGSQGIAKTAGHTGFYITSDVDYTLWFYDGSSWSAHQSIDVSDANYSEGFSFAWGSNTAAYIKTADSSHEVYVFGRNTDLKVDSTPDDGNQSFDQVVDGTGSLSITSIDAQNDYTSGISITDGTVSFNRTDQNAAYSLSFSGNGITVGNDGSNTITLTGADEFTSPLTTDGDMFVQSGGADSRLGIGSDGQYLSVSSGAPAWVDLSSGDVSTVGTPANDQLAVWTGNGTIEGTSSLIYQSSAFQVRGTGGSSYAYLRNSGDAEFQRNGDVLYMTPSYGNQDWSYIYTNVGRTLRIGAGTNTAMYFDNSGNVSVGKPVAIGTTLDARFEIKGAGNTSATSAFVVKNSSNTTLFEIKDDGSMTGVLAYNSAGVADFNTGTSSSLLNNLSGGFYVGTVATMGYGMNIDSGARAALFIGSAHNIDKYVDKSLVSGSYNQVLASTDSSHSSYATIGIRNSSLIGYYNYGSGYSVHAIGYSNQVWGSNNEAYTSVAIGNTNKLGSSSSHARDCYAFGKNLSFDPTDARSTMMIGFGMNADASADSDETPKILFGTESGRPSIAMYPDPTDSTNVANFVMGGTTVASAGTSYPLQSGVGSGCFIFADSSQYTKAPTVDVPNAVTLYIGDRSDSNGNTVVGGKGLIIKGENSGRSYISERVGINVSHNSAKASQINEEIEAGLHIFGEGNTDATSALKAENSDGDVAIEVLNDLVVVMPNLPTSSAGLPTGALYNDGGIVKVA